MKILGIDTATKFLCLGIYGDSHPVRNTAYGNRYNKISNGTQIYTYNLETNTRLSSLLSITIKRTLDALGWHINDIDYFACGLGPGSFTGVRVGLATIKGLAFSLNKPVIGISTLDILAKNSPAVDAHVIPIIDAKRDLIYCSVYKIKSGILKRIMPYMLLTIEEFFKRIKVRGNAIILGDALNLYKQSILMNMKQVTVLDKDYWYPRSHNIVDLALERIKGKKFDSAFKISPLYLYPKECQIKK